MKPWAPPSHAPVASFISKPLCTLANWRSWAESVAARLGSTVGTGQFSRSRSAPKPLIGPLASRQTVVPSACVYTTGRPVPVRPSSAASAPPAGTGQVSPGIAPVSFSQSLTALFSSAARDRTMSAASSWPSATC